MQRFDYEHSSIIRPPRDPAYLAHDSKAWRDVRVVVDSRDRDLTSFPTPARYDVEFEDPLENILSVELLCADVPFTSYLINSYAQDLTLIETQTGSSNARNLQLTAGDYGASNLAAHVQTVLATNGTAGVTYEVSYDLVKDNFQFMVSGSNVTSTKPFTLDLSNRPQLAAVLGFLPKAYGSIWDAGSSKQSLRSDFRKNFNYNNYMVMHVDSLENNRSPNKVLNKSFAILSKDRINNELIELESVCKEFNPPLSKLHKLRITFRDMEGNPYDFQNHPHRLEFLFRCHQFTFC